MYVENHSTTGWEPKIIKYICEPLVRRIPESITPNTISVANHLVAWSVFILGAVAPHLSAPSALITRIFAAVGVFTSLILDCLDGMHARRTGQGSKLGEVVDHWLDALNVPLMAAGMILTLRLDPWMTALMMISSTMPYSAQLVLYHHTRRFVHPPTSGVDGQVMVSFAYIAFGVFFYFVPQTHPWVKTGLFYFSMLILLMNLRIAYFYIHRLKGIMTPHLVFIGLCLAFATLYWVGLMSQVMFVLCVGTLSFRLCGSYVLYSVLERPYGGMDWRIIVWLTAIGATSWLLQPYTLGGVSLSAILPLAFFLHMSSLNLLDLLREAPALRPEREEY